MKTVLIVVSKDIIRRNILDTGFWPVLLQRYGAGQIVLVVEKEKEEWYREKYGGDRVKVFGYRRESYRGWAALVNFLIRTAGNTHSMRTYRNRAWRRGQSSLFSYLAKAFIANIVGGRGWYQQCIRGLVMQVPSPFSIRALFDEYAPALIFTPSLIDNDFDVPFAVEARRRGINIVGMVRSWDNFNNHGLLAIIPDMFLFQNSWLKEAARRFQNIDVDTLPHAIVGLPHYDTYRNIEGHLQGRAAFFEKFRISPEKRVILLGGSDFYYTEDLLPKTLNNAIAEGRIKDAHIIFRPHPASPFRMEDYNLDSLPYVTLNDAFSGDIKFSDADVFINLLHHCDVIVNICSTLSVDAAVVEKPAVVVAYDAPGKHLSYYERVERLYDQFDHYEELVGTGGVSVSYSGEDLIRFINRYIGSPRADAEGQRRIMKRFVEPFDGKAGERIGHIICEEVARIIE